MNRSAQDFDYPACIYSSRNCWVRHAGLQVIGNVIIVVHEHRWCAFIRFYSTGVQISI